MACDLVAGVDYDEAVCDNCGRDEHTEAQERECMDSIIGPYPCRNCGRIDLPLHVDYFCADCH